MKNSEHIYFLTLLGIFMLVLPLLGGSSIALSLTRRLWNDNILFTLCVAIFFYGWFFMKRIELADFRLMRGWIVLTLFFSVAALFVSRAVVAEEVLRLFLVILLIPCIDFLIRRCGVRLVGYLLVAIILIQSQWGLAQFITQRDLGFYLLGESRLSGEIVGVAKFDFSSCVNDCELGGEQKMIRAYGPFRHANVFGGVMAIGLMTVALLVTRTQKNFNVQFTERGRTILLSLILFLFLGLLVSFSRSAYLATGITLLVFVVVRFSFSEARRAKSRLIENNSFFVVPIIVVVLFSPLLIARFTDGEDAAIVERVGGAEWAVSLINNNSWWQGVGPGGYKEALRNYLDRHSVIYQPWQIDSVHSVPLLVAAEWGLMLSSIFMFLIWLMVAKRYSNTWHWFLPLIPIILFDHYLVTQSAPMVLVIVWVLMVYHLHLTALPQAVDLRKQ